MKVKVVLWFDARGNDKSPDAGTQEMECSKIEELAQHFDLMLTERHGYLTLTLDSKGGRFKQR